MLFGTGAFLSVTVSTSSSAQHVVAFADKPTSSGSDHVLVENMDSQSTNSTPQLTGYTGASVQVQRLTGGSPLATSGVLIQGAAVANDGTFTPRSPAAVACKAGVLGGPRAVFGRACHPRLLKT